MKASTSFWSLSWFWLLLLGGFLAVIYLAGLSGAFFFDDVPNILTVEGLPQEGSLSDILAQAIKGGVSSPLGRPVAQVSFALNYYFFGLDPLSFKLLNLAIHFLNTVLVYALSIHLLAGIWQPTQQKLIMVAALLLAALWALHPIQLLPVLHVVQRMTSLSALFMLAALWGHLRARDHESRYRYLWMLLAWGVCWPLAVLSKETGLLLPLFVLAWEVIIRRHCAGALDGFGKFYMVVCAVAGMLAAVFLFSSHAGWLWAGYELRGFGMFERTLTEGRVLWFYLGLIAFPRMNALGLYHDDFVLSSGFLAPASTVLAGLALAVLVWVAWRLRRVSPLASFGVAWFLIGHFLESTVLPLELVHEHRNYVPLFGVLLVVTSFIKPLMLRVGGIGRLICVVISVGALAYYSLITAMRAHLYGDELRRTQIEAQYHPNSARAQYDAGRSLADMPGGTDPESPAYSFAKYHLERAGELDPAFKSSWLGLIFMNCRASLPVPAQWLDELSARLQHTPFSPGDRNVLFSVKQLSVESGLCLNRVDVDRLFAAAAFNPTVSDAVRAMLHSWHADYLWLREKDMSAAQQALGESLRLVPGQQSNLLKLAQLKFISKDFIAANNLLLGLNINRLTTDERRTREGLLASMSTSKPE